MHPRAPAALNVLMHAAGFQEVAGECIATHHHCGFLLILLKGFFSSSNQTLYFIALFYISMIKGEVGKDRAEAQ